VKQESTTKTLVKSNANNVVLDGTTVILHQYYQQVANHAPLANGQINLAWQLTVAVNRAQLASGQQMIMDVPLIAHNATKVLTTMKLGETSVKNVPLAGITW
jgi:hypothetical protein